MQSVVTRQAQVTLQWSTTSSGYMYVYHVTAHVGIVRKRGRETDTERESACFLLGVVFNYYLISLKDFSRDGSYGRLDQFVIRNTVT